MINTPMINGQGYSWSSIRLNLFGRTITGFTAIEYDDPETKENVWGAGKHPVERGGGNVEPACSITLLKKEVVAIEAAAKAAGILRIQDIPPFDIVVSFTVGTTIKTDTISYCEFTNNPLSSKQGDTKIEVKCDLVVGEIVRD